MKLPFLLLIIFFSHEANADLVACDANGVPRYAQIDFLNSNVDLVACNISLNMEWKIKLKLVRKLWKRLQEYMA